MVNPEIVSHAAILVKPIIKKDHESLIKGLSEFVESEKKNEYKLEVLLNVYRFFKNRFNSELTIVGSEGFAGGNVTMEKALDRYDHSFKHLEVYMGYLNLIEQKLQSLGYNSLEDEISDLRNIFEEYQFKKEDS